MLLWIIGGLTFLVQGLALKFAGYSFRKARSLSMSNWSRIKLNEQQVLYAANDAWASWLVYQSLLAHVPSPSRPHALNIDEALEKDVA